jgi:YfiH family protein
VRLADCIVPEWPAPAAVGARAPTRGGGVSSGPYSSLNLGEHVGDASAAVAENRARLTRHLPSSPRWLTQVHGTTVVDAGSLSAPVEADASLTREAGVVCAVMTADCLPVLFCDRRGTVVAAAHAGWRGLAAGVLERTVVAMGAPPAEILAWLGPAIGPRAFEVGEEVREAFVADDAAAVSAFVANDRGRWQADLYALAHRRLAACGVSAVYGGGLCTFTDGARFFSFRRSPVTGRMATLVWLAR